MEKKQKVKNIFQIEKVEGRKKDMNKKNLLGREMENRLEFFFD